jgi:excisionase family DNA binding protein
MEDPNSASQHHIQPLAVSPSEAARLLGIGRTHLYELIGRGALRSVLLGKRRLIPIDAIKECLASNEVEP